MVERKTFQTLDIYLASFLAFHGLQPSFDNVNGKIAFSFAATDDFYKLLERYNSDEYVPVNSFVTVVKMLRGRMLSMRRAG